jgi:hypothetical protein
VATVGELSVLFGLTVDKSWDKAHGLIKGLQNAARVFVAGQAVAGIMHLVQSTTEAATHLYSMSQAMGLTVQQTQEFQYVAQQSGSDINKLSVGMSMLIGNLRKFSGGSGSKQFKKDMVEIGISQRDAAKALQSPDGMMAVLMKTSDHLQKLGKNGNAAGLGRELFGARAGRDLVADLARGSKAVEELMARRRAMGELDEKEVLSLRDLGNRMKDVKNSFSALAMSVVAKLAPTLLEMADSALKFITANKDIITGALSAAINIVAGAFRAVGAIIGVIADLIHSAFGGSTGAQAILIGIAVAIMTIVVPALWAMVAPIVIAMAPLLLIVAVVAVIAYGILQLIKHWDAVKNAAGHFAEYLHGLWSGFTGWLSDLWDSILKGLSDAWDSAVDGFKDGLSKAFEVVRNLPIIGELIDLVADLKKITGVGRSIGGAIFDATHDDGSDHSDEGDSPEAAAVRAQRYGKQNTSKQALAAAAQINNPGIGVPSAPGGDATNGNGVPAVAFGATNINIYGVKDGAEASGKIGEAVAIKNRQAAAALSKGKK